MVSLINSAFLVVGGCGQPGYWCQLGSAAGAASCNMLEGTGLGPQPMALLLPELSHGVPRHGDPGRGLVAQGVGMGVQRDVGTREWAQGCWRCGD